MNRLTIGLLVALAALSAVASTGLSVAKDDGIDVPSGAVRANP